MEPVRNGGVRVPITEIQLSDGHVAGGFHVLWPGIQPGKIADVIIINHYPFPRGW